MLSLVHLPKQKFERKLTKEAKCQKKKFYAHLKSRIRNKKPVVPLADCEKLVSDDTSMANLHNLIFISVFTEES